MCPPADLFFWKHVRVSVAWLAVSQIILCFSSLDKCSMENCVCCAVVVIDIVVSFHVFMMKWMMQVILMKSVMNFSLTRNRSHAM